MAKNKKTKRQASSPCENLIKSKPKIEVEEAISEDLFQSFESQQSTMNNSTQAYDHFCIRVVAKNNEDFVGALSLSDCKVVWNSLDLGVNNSLLYGIALIQSQDRPFMMKFQLNDAMFLDELKPEFKLKLDEDEYTLKLVTPREAPPNLGEDFPITIKNTRFNITLDKVDDIMSRFGVITEKAIHVESKEEPGVKTDDVSCVVKLRKHMPSFLPAYGVKLNIRYHG